MVDRDAVERYQGTALMRGPGYVYLQPDPRLLPFLANYTFTCPTPSSMTDGYTVLPTASSTIVYAVGEGRVHGSLNGVNTRAKTVGGYANRFALLLLIEFHPGGLYPLLGIPQAELQDNSFPLECLDRALHRQLLNALLREESVEGLVAALNGIFLSRLAGAALHPQFQLAVEQIRGSRGAVSSAHLARAVFYSEKQLGRIFRQHLGAGVKTFSRVVRVNCAIRLLQQKRSGLAGVGAEAGYFDQAHFIRDFRALCGVSPQAYLDRMSVFYNDHFKL